MENLIRKIHGEVIKKKENGQTIKMTLKKLGISKQTYYRHLKKSGETKWGQIKHEKMETKIDNRHDLEREMLSKTQKRKRGGMSGGSVATTKMEDGKNRLSETVRSLKEESLRQDERCNQMYTRYKNECHRKPNRGS